jgi:peptidoglycan/xylan/chitin deacetylase (PgdA/CDA1 family)
LIPALRSRLKGAVEPLLIRSGTAAVARALSRSRRLVLAYHNVVPGPDTVQGDRSLHLSREQFSAQLDLLKQSCEVVPLASLLAGARTSAGRPRVAITFDDGYRGAVRIGVDELARRGLPATIFVAPAFVGGRSFWWDALGGPGGEGIDDRFRARALDRDRGLDPEIRQRASREGLTERALGQYAVAATEAELREATRIPGITLGSHTWSHPNLTRLNQGELRDELASPLEWLRQRFDRVIPWLSYPYGLSSPAVERAVEEAGYEGALRVAGGWISTRVLNRYALPRFNVPAGLSREGFHLRVSGLFAGR